MNLVLALVVITAPPDTAYEVPPCPMHSLQAVAVALELLDRRDCQYYFRWREQLEYDTREMRKRWAELRNAPPVVDAVRFPGLDVCRDAIDANRSYRRWLLDRAILFPNDMWITEAIGECERLWHVWDRVSDSQREYRINYRRACLMRIRDEIGPHLYYAGCLPPPVPVWRLWRID